VAVIEDVHWADEATIDLLRFLGRRVRNAAMLLIVTYRDDGSVTSDPLRLALGELARQRTTRRVALAPLSAAAVRILAAGSGLEAAVLFRLTGETRSTSARWCRPGWVRFPLPRATRCSLGPRAWAASPAICRISRR
jgi:hypothetical protein